MRLKFDVYFPTPKNSKEASWKSELKNLEENNEVENRAF